MSEGSLVIDTNAVLRYLLRDNEKQYIVTNDLFEAIKIGNKKAVLLESVLTECLYVLTKFYTVPKSSCHFKVKTSDGKDLYIGGGLNTILKLITMET